VVVVKAGAGALNGTERPEGARRLVATTGAVIEDDVDDDDVVVAPLEKVVTGVVDWTPATPCSPDGEPGARPGTAVAGDDGVREPGGRPGTTVAGDDGVRGDVPERATAT